MNPVEFSAVDVDYAAISPMLVVVAGALLGVLVEAFAPRRSRHGIQVGLTSLTIAAAFVALVVWSRDSQTVTLGGSVGIDGVSVFRMGGLLLLALISGLVRAERFGGVTSYLRSPAQGLWEDAAGDLCRDEVVLFEVVATRLDRAWWQAFKLRLLARFSQQELLLRASRVSLL